MSRGPWSRGTARGGRERCPAVGAGLLQAFLDGEVDPVTGHSVRSHVDGCSRCRQDLAAYRGIAKALVRHGGTDVAAVERLRAFADALLEQDCVQDCVQDGVQGGVPKGVRDGVVAEGAGDGRGVHGDQAVPGVHGARDAGNAVSEADA